MEPPLPARRMCASHVNVSVGDVRVVRALKKRRNNLFTLEAKVGCGDNEIARFFIKERRQQHNPQCWRVDLDFAGLSYLVEHGPVGHGFCYVGPIGFDVSPRKYLVTEYQPGQTLDGLYAMAVISGKGLEKAIDSSTRLGRWLAAFRQSGSCDAPHDAVRCAIVEVADRIRACVGSCAMQVPRGNAGFIRVLRQLVDGGESSVQKARPVHGDVVSQNFILGANGSISPIDLSGFGFRVLDYDVASYRIRLEKAIVLSGQGGVQRAGAIWRSFWDAYVGCGGSAGLCVVSYLHRVSSILLRLPRTLGDWKSPRAIARRFRDNRWHRIRLQWFAEMPWEGTELIEYVRNVL
jgi:hypothetical protein